MKKVDPTPSRVTTPDTSPSNLRLSSSLNLKSTSLSSSTPVTSRLSITTYDTPLTVQTTPTTKAQYSPALSAESTPRSSRFLSRQTTVECFQVRSIISVCQSPLMTHPSLCRPHPLPKLNIPLHCLQNRPRGHLAFSVCRLQSNVSRYVASFLCVNHHL